MNCRNCGIKIPDNYLKLDSFRCPKCGRRYQRMPNPSKQESVNPAFSNRTSNLGKKRSKSKVNAKAYILLAVLLIIIGLVVAGIIDGVNEAKRKKNEVFTQILADNLDEKITTTPQVVEQTPVSSQSTGIVYDEQTQVRSLIASAFNSLPEANAGTMACLVYDYATGNSRYTTQEAAADYIETVINADTGNINSDTTMDTSVFWADDIGSWALEIDITWPDITAQEMLEEDDVAIYTIFRMQMIDRLQYLMKNLVGVEAVIGINIQSEERGDVLRIYSPKTHEFGEDELSAGVYRYDTEEEPAKNDTLTIITTSWLTQMASSSISEWITWTALKPWSQ